MKTGIETFLLLITISFIQCTTLRNSENVSDTISLFSDSLDDWTEHGDAKWRLDKGELTGSDGEAGYVLTKQSYVNFILTTDFYPDEKVNSGIFIRCQDQTISPITCLEINIWDNHTNQDFRTGAIVTHGKPLAQVNSVNQWNTYKIKAKDQHIEVWLNGIKTADYTANQQNYGMIGLQANGGTIKFRNTRLNLLAK